MDIEGNVSRNTGLRCIQCFSGNQIKLIAVVCMFIDHLNKTVLVAVSQAFLGPMYRAGELSWETYERFMIWNDFLDPIGAVAFPLFCFMFVEGYQHTKDKRKYFLRLALFAVISEIPFDLAFFSDFDGYTWPFYWFYQNVFFTFLLGMITLYLLDQASRISRKALSVCIQGCIVAVVCCLAQFVVRGDYRGYGVALIVTFYVLRRNRWLQVAGPILLMTIVYNPHPAALITACLLILLYNGKRGERKMKYFFYVFYPAHITVLYFAEQLLRRLAQ